MFCLRTHKFYHDLKSCNGDVYSDWCWILPHREWVIQTHTHTHNRSGHNVKQSLNNTSPTASWLIKPLPTTAPVQFFFFFNFILTCCSCFRRCGRFYPLSLSYFHHSLHPPQKTERAIYGPLRYIIQPNLGSPSASLTVRVRRSLRQQSLAKVATVTGSQPVHLNPDKQ